MQYCTYKNRKPGRPKAIPGTMEAMVIDLYKQGLGYRAIKRELGKEGLLVHWSTVRRFIKLTLGNSSVRGLSKYSHDVLPNSVPDPPRVVCVLTPVNQAINNRCIDKPGDQNICYWNKNNKEAGIHGRN